LKIRIDLENCFMCKALVSAMWMVCACGWALAQAPQFAYIANANTDNLSGYRIDPATGVLTAVPGSPIATGHLGNSSIVVDQADRFVYVLSGDGTVAGYKVDPVTGQLNDLPGGSVVAGNTTSLAIVPSGRFAYLLQYAPDVQLPTLSAYRIDRITGHLTAVQEAPFPLSIAASSINIDPLGKFVYLPTPADQNNVSVFAINPKNAVLTPVTGSPFPGGQSVPSSISIDPLDRFAFGAAESTMNGYSISPSTGAVSILNTPSLGTANPESQAVDPRGKFLYVAGVTGLYAYSISATYPPNPTVTSLTLLPGSPFGPSSSSPYLYPVSVVVDYTGTFLYATYYLGAVIGFKIDPNSGVLTQLPGSPVSTGNSPPTIALVRPMTFPVYTAKQVPEPALGPFTSFTGTAINNKGEVTGQAVLSAGGEFLAETFLYDGTTTTGFFPPGSKSSTGSALNDKGEIVGTLFGPAFTPFFPLPQSFLYRSGTTFLLDPRTGGESMALGINNAEHITGSISTGACSFCTNFGDTHAFLDSGQGPIDIGTLGGNFSEGTGINQHDELTGGSNVTSNGPNHVFVYSHGSFQDLGMFEGYSSVGTAISDSGKLIGTATAPSGASIGFVSRNNYLEPIPPLEGGVNSVPSGINLQGIVVGASDVAGGGPTHAFLYWAQDLIDLNSLVEPSLTLLTGAAGINDQGQILAGGLDGALYVLTLRK
jgi:probable HAF family extracellular repeat protein